MTMLIIMNILMSSIFLMLTHPLSLGLILLIQTTLISLITGNMAPNFWFSYILFLILIGGMLILFMYMTSIASNEKFSVKTIPMAIIMTATFMVIMMIPMNFMMPELHYTNEATQFNMNIKITSSMSKYVYLPSNMILSFLVIYLLITLIATVKITSLESGPLRQMN